MAERLIIDGNAVYEIDEDCMRRMGKKTKFEKEGAPDDGQKPVRLIHRRDRRNGGKG